MLFPQYYFVYIWITELKLSHVGCYMGSVFAGEFVFADDIKLLAPSIEALNIMLEICVKYAKRFYVCFNDKSQLIVYKSKDDIVAIPDMEINGTKIKVVNSITHLGHILKDNIFYCDSSKCMKNFNIQ